MNDPKRSGKTETQAELTRRALETKQRAEKDAEQTRPESRTAGEGQVQNQQPGAPPMGALDAEGHRPVLERSRKVR